MVAVLICDQNSRECTEIGEDCKTQIARFSDETLHMSIIPDDHALKQVAESERPINLLYYEFQNSGHVSGLRLLRKQYGDAMVMLIAETTVSPLAYLRPGIAPDALLLRPIEPAQLHELNREFVQSYFEKIEYDSTQDSFVVDTREEKAVIPYSHIYYFEAREKKVFLRTRHEEYAFYGTIDTLEKSLPAAFQRCHRSYIVNLNKLVRVVSAENYMELMDQMMVPVSRRYKSALKEALL